MLLTVKERLLLQGLIQKKPGNLVTIRLLHELQMALGFSDEEATALELTATDIGVTWNIKNEKDKEIPIGDATKGIIVETLNELDARNALTAELLPLCERFLGVVIDDKLSEEGK